MSDGLRSILLGQAALYAVMAAALGLAFARPVTAEAPQLRALGRLFLIGVACQCVHLIEELVTGFHQELPRLLGLADWSVEFFISFNVIWLALWAGAAAAIESRSRAAFFPIWFFALGMVGNAIWHPLLAMARRGYFPGLFTSPIVGVAGVVVLRRLLAVTAARSGRM